MNRLILIDGYNVIRADPRLSDVESGSMEVAREALVSMIRTAPKLRGDRVMVVFDGGAARSFGTVQRLGDVSVHYSQPGQTADDLIRNLANQQRDPSGVVVVTRDLQIRDDCRALGCAVTEPANFLSQIETGGSRARPGAAYDGRASPDAGPKKGNPRRLSKKARRSQDYRF